jgi:hypothetical protein
MTGGSIAGTVLLLLAAQVQNLTQLYAVWTGIGPVGAAVLYEVALAIVVTWYPERFGRANAVLAISVVAGFASSIFLPLAGALVAAHGWRATVTILGAVNSRRRDGPAAPAAAPPTRFGRVRLVGADPDQIGRAAGTRPRPRRTPALRDHGFWLLAAVFVAHGAAVAIMSVHLVAYLIDLGHPSAFAATVAGGLDILSVTGRLVTTGAQRRWPATGWLPPSSCSRPRPRSRCPPSARASPVPSPPSWPSGSVLASPPSPVPPCSPTATAPPVSPPSPGCSPYL